MTKLNKLLLASALGILFFFFFFPIAVAAANPDAFQALREYFSFLIRLAVEMAQKGLEALIKYFEALE